jgi:hypothetical protein
MKALRLFSIVAFVLIVLASCEHDVATETTVHPDGTLDKSFTLELSDSARYMMFNLEGWTKTSPHVKGESIDSARSMKITTQFQKTYSSAEEANAQLSTSTDTTLAISSKFEKKFRWFYTYISYSDTYHAINRLEYPIENYVTSEDYAFIDRLPAEGKKISKADSLYLSDLHKKLFDVYGLRALFEVYWNVNLNLLQEHHLDPSWTDSLNQHKERAFALMTDEHSNQEMTDYFMIDFMEQWHIPLPYETVRRDYMNRIKPLERTTNFISKASDGKFTHRINMPWTLVKTNADSTAGNSAYWAPPTIKFLLKDYTMYAEARKLNWWAVIISAFVVGLTVFLFVRKRI